MQPITVTINEPAPWISVLGAIAGVIIGALLPYFPKRLEEKRQRESALLQLRAALRGAFPALQTAYDVRMIDRAIFTAALQRYITVARDPAILAHLHDDQQALWVAGATSVFELAVIHFSNVVYQDVPNDPLRRQIVPDETSRVVLLPGLSAAASTLQALGDLPYLEKTASASVKAAISEFTRRNRAERERQAQNAQPD